MSHLESYRFSDALTWSENHAAALAVEAKWLRWFADSPLLGVEVMSGSAR